MTPKRPRDPNQLAKSIIDIATGQKPDRDPTPEEQGKRSVAVESGSRGGKLRAKLLSPQERQRIARKAAEARWELRLCRERKSINSGRVHQSLLDALHDDEWLHHRLSKSKSESALMPAPDKYTDRRTRAASSPGLGEPANSRELFRKNWEFS